MRILLLMIATVFLIACDSESPNPVEPDPNGDPSPPTLAQVQSTVFSASCALSGCHAAPSPQEGMNLSAGSAYASIVSVPSNQRPEMNRVEPGDPENSYLVWKIEGRSGIQGGRMPLGGAALPNSSIELVRAWIADGAQDN